MLIGVIFGFVLGVVLTDILPIIGFHSIGTNSFLPKAMPFFFTGMIIKKKEKQILNVSTRVFFVLLFLGIMMLLFDTYIKINTCYIGAVFSSISLFVISIKHPNEKIVCLEMLGNQCGFYIYILHPIVMHIFDYYINKTSDGIVMWIRPIAVLILTIFAAILIWKFNEKTKCKTKS